MHQKKKSFLTSVRIGLSFVALGLLGAGYGSARDETKPEPIPVEIRKDIRVVYQINTDEWREGVGKGLLYLEKLTEAYGEIGVSGKDRRISAVFHGEAGYWMLNDEAYASFKKAEGENPNKETIATLAGEGVSIELCAETMKNNGWKPKDLLPGVRIVVGAYPRVIDLQLQGYAYIRF